VPQTARPRPSRPSSRATVQALETPEVELASPSAAEPDRKVIVRKKAPTPRLRPREAKPTPEHAWAADAQAHLKAVRALRDQLQRDIGHPGPGDLRYHELLEEPRNAPKKQAVLGSAAAEDELKRRRAEERAVSDALLDRLEATERVIFEVMQRKGELQRLRAVLLGSLSVAEKRLDLRMHRPEQEQINDAFHEALDNEVSVLRTARSQLQSQLDLGKEKLAPLTAARDEMLQRRLTLHLDRTGQAWFFLQNIRQNEEAAERYCSAAVVLLQQAEQRAEKAAARTVAAMRKRLSETFGMRKQLEAEAKEAAAAIAEAERRLDRMQRRLRDYREGPGRDLIERPVGYSKSATAMALASAGMLSTASSRGGGGGGSTHNASTSASPWAGKLARLRQKVRAAAITGQGKQLDVVFKRLDRDGSGELGEDEVRSALRRVWKISAEVISDAEVSMLCNALDTDRSGYVSVEELVMFLGADTDVEALEEQIHIAVSTLEQLRVAHANLVEELRRKTAAWKIDEVCSRVTPAKGLDTHSGTQTEKSAESAGRRPTMLKPESIDALKSRTTKAALEMVFSRFDREGTGMLDDSEVQQALRRTLRIPSSVFSDDDIASLCSMLGANSQGGVKVHELIEFVGADIDAGSKQRMPQLASCRQGAGTPSTAASASGSRAPTPMGCPSGARSAAGTPTRRLRPRRLPTDVVEGYRAKIRSAAAAATATGPHGGPQLEAILARYDKDGSGRLEPDDVRLALRKLRVPPKAISDADVASLCSMLDASGTVGIHQLVEFVGV